MTYSDGQQRYLVGFIAGIISLYLNSADVRDYALARLKERPEEALSDVISYGIEHGVPAAVLGAAKLEALTTWGRLWPLLN